jgi:hypothetical protein
MLGSPYRSGSLFRGRATRIGVRVGLAQTEVSDSAGNPDADRSPNGAVVVAEAAKRKREWTGSTSGFLDRGLVGHRHTAIAANLVIYSELVGVP